MDSLFIRVYSFFAKRNRLPHHCHASGTNSRSTKKPNPLNSEPSPKTTWWPDKYRRDKPLFFQFRPQTSRHTLELKLFPYFHIQIQPLSDSVKAKQSRAWTLNLEPLKIPSTESKIRKSHDHQQYHGLKQPLGLFLRLRTAVGPTRHPVIFGSWRQLT